MLFRQLWIFDSGRLEIPILGTSEKRSVHVCGSGYRNPVGPYVIFAEWRK